MDYHTKVMSVQCPPKCLNVAFAHYDISIRVYALQCYVRKDSSRASVLRHGGCTILDIGVFVGEGDAVSACFGPLDRCNALATKHFRIVSGFEPNPLDRIFFWGDGIFLNCFAMYVLPWRHRFAWRSCQYKLDSRLPTFNLERALMVVVAVVVMMMLIYWIK